MTEIEEKELMKSVENNEWKSAENFNDIKASLIKAAGETSLKDYRKMQQKTDISSIN